jgi:dGTPase
MLQTDPPENLSRPNLTPVPEGGVADGFQGNAQNLRIIGSLESRRTAAHRGLHLSRAAMDASIKYPWLRTPEGLSAKGYKAWGAYPEDAEELAWVLGQAPLTAPAAEEELPPRPVEEQIMDWADDVTYACHDVEDFFRNGFIPLHLILRFPPPDARRRVETEPYEAEAFLDYVEAKRGGPTEFNRHQAIADLRTVETLATLPGPYDGSHATKVLATSMTSRLIRFFLDGVTLEETSPGVQHLTRYSARLVVPQDQRRVCDLLKELIWYHVIDRPGLASQQHGQRRVVRKLLRWHAEEYRRLLPADRLADVEKGHRSVLRAACDHVASLTERQAHALYQRMAGIEHGAITDQFE